MINLILKRDITTHPATKRFYVAVLNLAMVHQALLVDSGIIAEITIMF